MKTNEITIDIDEIAREIDETTIKFDDITKQKDEKQSKAKAIQGD